MSQRVMIFYDLENFKMSLGHINRKMKQYRKYDYGKVQYLVIELLRKFLHIKELTPSSLIRAYAYTGEYTKEIVHRIEQEIKEMECNGEPPQNIEERRKLYSKTKERFEAQKRFIKSIANYHFFELRTYPLKYRNGQIFQKGVDVQLAVDLVTHAFRDNFDIAVICSGDIDLLESLKIVKSLGKRVVVMSHPKQTARAIRKEADFYIDIGKLNEEDLNKIIFVEKEESQHE
ncbi:hypothetical protein B6U74_05230 [Candidatus Bathyarchaeota archaeon ex4484_205]|nr:MAG: hypothetical protein B6U74_05230 [Candidatus Bathyarchaeota archaeon ex4484_205]RLA96711.1 MAG: hypothetical protein DRG69_00005 [Deltaproteobacteria bacterium]RLF71729.1 MAG: hypothetical protein DRN40_01895 [Thermoplasmata archaeon]